MLFKRMRIFFKSSPLRGRICFAVLVILTYMLGRSLPIVTAPLEFTMFGDEKSQEVLSHLATVTGGQLSGITLFSLGLSPWMTAQILWRFVMVFEWFKDLTNTQIYHRQLFLTLVVAFIQAFGLTATIDFVSQSNSFFQSESVLRLVTIGIMVGGAFILTWLGNINSIKGLGGSTLIIIVNMVLSFFANIITFWNEESGVVLWFQGILAIVAFIFLVGLAILSYRAEYRISIHRIIIATPYKDKSYIPIRINPAGGMPFMYGMTLMILPPLLFQGLLLIYPKNAIFLYLLQNMRLTSWVGAIFYAGLLYVLSIGFTYYNYDPVKIAKSMQDSGDYIESVRPGSETQKYMRRYLSFLAHIGAILVCFVGVGPLMFILGQDSKSSLALLVSNIFVITTLLLGVVEQVNMLQLWKKYDKLL